MTEHIVAVFDNEGTAAAAERELRDVGIPASDVRRYRSNEGRSGTTASTKTTTESSGGFWAWLLGEEGPRVSYRTDYDSDAETYDRGISAGHVVLTVTLQDESRIDKAMDILDSHDPVELDERPDESATASQTAAVGAPGVEFSSSATARPNQAATPVAPSTGATAGPGGAGTAAGGTMGTASTTSSAGTKGPTDEVVPLAEEELEVGKRTIDRGVTRVRRYVVAKPVERDVELHGERVTIERRSPVASTGAPGAGAFEERTVEVREFEEVPVTQKRARVTEEVLVHREDTSRTEKVRDTVRKEEVDVNRTGERPKV